MPPPRPTRPKHAVVHVSRAQRHPSTLNKMNNNKTTLEGLLGVFAKPQFMIGTADEPLPYAPSNPTPERFKGRQLGTAAPQPYFDKERALFLASSGDEYADRVRYADLQDEKPGKGFGTSDFSKRDEFSNTVRTLQWREQLRREQRWCRAAIEQLGGGCGGGCARSGGVSLQQPPPEQQQQQQQQEVLLYDLLHAPPPGPKAPAASATRRDTLNRTALSRERALGGQLTMHQLAFAPAAAAAPLAKPEFARRPLVRSTFYRSTNIPMAWPAGSDAGSSSA